MAFLPKILVMFMRDMFRGVMAFNIACKGRTRKKRSRKNYQNMMSKYIKIFFNSFLNFFLIFLGFLICSYFFFIRIILVRVPHKMTFSWNIVLFSFYVFLTLLFLLKIKKHFFPKKSSFSIFINKLFEPLILLLFSLYDSALYKFYITIFHNKNLEFLTKGLYYFCNYFKNFCLSSIMSNFHIKLIFSYIIYVIPRFIILIALFIDTIIYQEFYYLYKVIWIILIPFCFKIFYYIMNQFNIQRFKELEVCFTINIKKNKNTYYLEIFEKTNIINSYYSFSEEIIKQGKEDIRMYFIIYKKFLEIFTIEFINESELYKQLQLFFYLGYSIIFSYTAFKMLSQLLYLFYIFQ